METNNTDVSKQPKRNALLGTLLWLIFLAVVMVGSLYPQSRSAHIPYSEFLDLLDRDKIVKVVISDTLISGEMTSSDPTRPAHFTTNALPDTGLVPMLHQKKIVFERDIKNPFLGFLFAWIVPMAIFYWLLHFAMSGMTKGAGGLLSMTKSRAKIFMEKDIKTTFADVAGIDEAKEELLEVVRFLQNPSWYSRLGGRAPKGVLLVGPPGTGKTLLARALAGEARVPFFSINGSEFVEMFVGLGAARVRDLFNQARGQAPCILFIDEIDALGKSRTLNLMGAGGNDEKEQTLNQLLAEMDGFDASVGVIMLAATNRPEILDPALLRAGRFDRQILLTSPDRLGRLQILKVHGQRIQLDPAIDLSHIAALTPGFSGAELANLVNEAALVATRRHGDSVTEADFSQAIERLVAGLETKSKVMNPKEKQRIAYHELGHATLALGIACADKVHKVSIIPRGMGALGYTLQRPTEDRYVVDEEELLDKIAVLLGGRAAEKIFCGKISTGAADDLAKATDIARAMVTQFGMSEKLGMVALEGRSSAFLLTAHEFTPKFLGETTAGDIDAEIKAIIEKCFQRANACLQKHQGFIQAALAALLSTETLNEADITALWRQYGQEPGVSAAPAVG